MCRHVVAGMHKMNTFAKGHDSMTKDLMIEEARRILVIGFVRYSMSGRGDELVRAK